MKGYMKALAILLVSILLVGCSERNASPNSTVSVTTEPTPTVQATPRKSPEPLQTTEPMPTPAGTPQYGAPLSREDLGIYDAEGNMVWTAEGVFPPGNVLVHFLHEDDEWNSWGCTNNCIQTYRGMKVGDDAVEALQKYDLSTQDFEIKDAPIMEWEGKKTDATTYYRNLYGNTLGDLLPHFDEIERSGGYIVIRFDGPYYKNGEIKTVPEAEEAGWLENWSIHVGDAPENPTAWEWRMTVFVENGKIQDVTYGFRYIETE